MLACALVALVAVPPAAATGVKRPPVSWLKGEGNFTKAHRAPTSIDRIVVHVTEGPFWGSVSWLKSDRSHASAHYVISRRGRIVQLVHQSDIAWHAGNWRVNVESIGIEHEGVTDSPAGFTDAQYVSSARLSAYIARQSVMPIDRRHFVGHVEVPGATHTDPGRHWNWGRYLRLVRKYAFPPRKPRPKPVRLRVESATVYRGQTVSGKVPWRARTSGPVRRVDFLVDGKLRWRDRRAPFAFAGGRGWSTAGLANGRHTLELRAFGPKGAWTRRRLVVRVVNLPPLALAVTAAKREVAGVVPVTAETAARRVELFLDGKRIDHDTSLPFAFAWDTARTANGKHTLEVVAQAKDGRTARKRFEVVVANPAVRSSSLAEGQTVSGVVEWTAEVEGRLELLVDGVVRATSSPFAWDTATEAPGPHALVVRALGPAGRVAEAAVTVVVAG